MYQEYLGVDFHNKHCFINLLVDKIWDANKQSGMIHFNLVTEYNNPNIYWKKKKKVVNVLDMWSNSLWGGGGGAERERKRHSLIAIGWWIK